MNNKLSDLKELALKVKETEGIAFYSKAIVAANKFSEAMTPDVIILLIEQLEAAEALAEFRGKNISSLDKLIAERDKRNAECDRLIIEKGLARIKAAPDKPDYFIHRVEVCDSYGPDSELRAFNNALDASKCRDDHGGEVIEVFAAQPAVLPKDIPKAFYQVLYDQCDGFVDGDVNAQEIWAAFRKMAIALSGQPQKPQLQENLYRLANHIASAKGGMPDGWEDWAEEIESDLRRYAAGGEVE